jgi:hypothetical protein
MSDEALRQRRHNLRRRLRSNRESQLIKLLIWQAFFGEEPRPSQRALARELGVWPSYVCKVQKKATSVGWDACVQYGRRVNLDDLVDARRFTAKLREQEPGLLAPAPQPRGFNEPRCTTADHNQRETQEMIRKAHRQNPGAQQRTMQEWRELEQQGERRGGWFRW